MSGWRVPLVVWTGHFLVIGHQEAVVIVLGVVTEQADVIQGGGHRGWR